MKKIRTAAAVMTAAAAAAALAGCGGKKETGNANELTYWVEFANQPAAGVANYDELPVYQELQKRLGVDIKFIHPVAGQTEEQLNLMLASREFPDIIQYQFYEYPGGAQKAIDDSVIIPLNDIMEKNAPNLSRYLAENSDVDREVKTDENNYYCFPNIYGDEYLLTYSGPIVRQDFLDKVGLEQPETIDEWHTTLKAFREKLSLPSPYSAKIDGLLATFTQAFGVGSDIYVDGGKVKYGPYEAGYKGVRIFRAVNALVMIALMIIMLYPLWYILVASFSSNSEVMKAGGSMLWVRGFTPAAYKAVFRLPTIWSGYRNTLFILVVGVTVNIALTAVGGYFLSRKNVYWSRYIAVAIVFTMYFSGGTIPFYFAVRDLHLDNTLWSLIFPTAISTYNLINMRTAFAAIPDSLEESAKLDGARQIVILVRIMLPLAMPTISVLIMYYGVSTGIHGSTR